MNKEQIIDDAYENYLENCLDIKWMKENFFYDGSSNHHVYRIIKESFIRKCKTDPEFSEKWGLKIEERKLSLEERLELWYQKNKSETGKRGIWEIDYIEKYEGHKKLNSYNIPTKLITITYNNETIESYE